MDAVITMRTEQHIALSLSARQYTMNSIELAMVLYYHLMFVSLGCVHHVKNLESFLNRLVSLKGDRLNSLVLPLGAE
jgi:hypothetical protein